MGYSSFEQSTIGTVTVRKTIGKLANGARTGGCRRDRFRGCRCCRDQAAFRSRREGRVPRAGGLGQPG